MGLAKGDGLLDVGDEVGQAVVGSDGLQEVRELAQGAADGRSLVAIVGAGVPDGPARERVVLGIEAD
eukprot:10510806-Alexandrium_andersonii.AAC.1